jgi:hypothetical protein
MKPGIGTGIEAGRKLWWGFENKSRGRRVVEKKLERAVRRKGGKDAERSERRDFGKEVEGKKYSGFF